MCMISLIFSQPDQDLNFIMPCAKWYLYAVIAFRRNNKCIIIVKLVILHKFNINWIIFFLNFNLIEGASSFIFILICKILFYIHIHFFDSFWIMCYFYMELLNFVFMISSKKFSSYQVELLFFQKLKPMEA